jgi:hypothetical protein
MQDAATAGLESALHELSSSARRKFDTARILTDEVRALTYRRGAELTQEAVSPSGEEVARARNALLAVIDRLKEQARVVMDARAGSERLAELLLIVGGGIILALPVVAIVTNLRGAQIGWTQNLLNGLTAVGFTALIFGPGREIRRAAKDRTLLLLLPIGFEARVVAASTMEEMRTVAGDLQRTISGLAPPES